MIYTKDYYNPLLIGADFRFRPFFLPMISRIATYRIVALSLLLVAGVGLSSCKQKPVDLPTGTQTLTGILLPVPFALDRRGTHQLTVQGAPVYLVESARVNLRTLEGMAVVVSGHVERNIDPNALPVLVASGVTMINPLFRTWDVPQFKVSLDVPPEWNPSFFPDGVRFSETGGSVKLSLHPSLAATLPPGDFMQIGGRTAVRTTATGSETIFVQNGSSIFAIQHYLDDPSTSTTFPLVLRSIRFSRSSAMSAGSSVSMGTGTTVTGNPCGGVAGILCPSGQFCEITDMASNSGRCKPLKR